MGGATCLAHEILWARHEFLRLAHQCLCRISVPCPCPRIWCLATKLCARKFVGKAPKFVGKGTYIRGQGTKIRGQGTKTRGQGTFLGFKPCPKRALFTSFCALPTKFCALPTSCCALPTPLGLIYIYIYVYMYIYFSRYIHIYIYILRAV